MPGSQPPAFLLPLQGLLKKHEAFETDFTVHKDRVNDVCSNGQDLIKKVSWGDAHFPHPTPPCWGRGPRKAHLPGISTLERFAWRPGATGSRQNWLEMQEAS